MTEHPEYIIDNEKSLDFEGIDNYLDIYKRNGVLFFRNFLDEDPLFEDFYNEVKELALLICKKHGLAINFDLPLNEILTCISHTHRREIGFLYDLGTRPLKIMSGVKLKSHPVIMRMIKTIMGENSIIACPYQGETLHIFPPGEENYKYNLPMHQDYPYIMQSPEQITGYFNLGKLQKEKNGGIKVWLGSHKEGVSPSKVLPNNLRVTANADHFIKKYPVVDISFDRSDFALFDSLLQHEGIQNHTNCTRIVQLARYSNLNNETSTSYYWQSCKSLTKGIQFSDIHK